MNAIFSTKAPLSGPTRGLGANGVEAETEPHRMFEDSRFAGRPKDGSLEWKPGASRVLVALALICLGVSLIGGAFFAGSTSFHVSSPGGAGPSPAPAVRAVLRLVPSFYAVSNVPEMIVSNSGSYGGASAVSAGEFLIVQIAYSEGSPGNLPDVSDVRDTLHSVYTREASASPGVGSNFWEQIWAARALSSPSTANITVTPDWHGCLIPCVSSIIITMNIARYRNVGSVGPSITIAPNYSSTSQVVTIGVTRPGSMLVELLSHGAYQDCQVDAALPRSGQTSRTCTTGTTERVELFDHSASNTGIYNESYVWSQLEVQRGIYLALQSSA